MPKFQTVTVNPVYEYAGEHYEIGADEYAQEFAESGGYTIRTKTKTETRRDGTKYQRTELDYEIEDGRGYEWNRVNFALDATPAKRLEMAKWAVEKLDAPEEWAEEVAALLSVGLEGRGWQAGRVKDADDLETIEVFDVNGYFPYPSEGRDGQDGPEFQHYESEDGSGLELAKEETSIDWAIARAQEFADVWEKAREALQEDAEDVQSNLDQCERATYEADVESDVKAATFRAWKDKNGIESDLEYWDVETQETDGDDVYEVTDGQYAKLPTLAKAQKTVDHFTA